MEKRLKLSEPFPKIRLQFLYALGNKQNKDMDKAEQYMKKGFKLIEKVPYKGIIEGVLVGIIDFFARNNYYSEKRGVYVDKVV